MFITLLLAIPVALQVLGIDVRIWGREKAEGGMNLRTHSGKIGKWDKHKAWIALGVSAVSLVAISADLYYHVKPRIVTVGTGTHIAWQKPIHSDDPRFPFELEVGIQTDEEYFEPAQLFIMCDGE